MRGWGVVFQFRAALRPVLLEVQRLVLNMNSMKPPSRTTTAWSRKAATTVCLYTFEAYLFAGCHGIEGRYHDSSPKPGEPAPELRHHSGRLLFPLPPPSSFIAPPPHPFIDYPPLFPQNPLIQTSPSPPTNQTAESSPYQSPLSHQTDAGPSSPHKTASRRLALFPGLGYTFPALFHPSRPSNPSFPPTISFPPTFFSPPAHPHP